ncbi:TPA: minor capsid protein [Streptococcus suis]|uniref:minor capsid protein n=1 Tax=Streptococcus suis TaxID=1307 RepID=UPI001478F75A|nr:minor capsid protein [Streptococcus suis]MCB2935798.1 minor capsid protein [Streptococcus suis]HEL2155417.1 minor capsid protein [Streptococcus suis]HEL9606696.1 minor capsid protein [Streptococcus suis]HEM2658007.1 minor capsid protein [Streptococcus suis]HEM5289138.1 minor capsid protein [Streptococcus suis]
MDFLNQLKKHINENLNLPFQMKIGYLDDQESLVVYTLPGSSVKRVYYDGTRELTLSIEIAIKSKQGQLAEESLWQIASLLEVLEDLPSANGSFELEDIEVTSRPFMNEVHEQGWLVFLLNAKVNITQLKEN